MTLSTMMLSSIWIVPIECGFGRLLPTRPRKGLEIIEWNVDYGRDLPYSPILVLSFAYIFELCRPTWRTVRLLMDMVHDQYYCYEQMNKYYRIIIIVMIMRCAVVVVVAFFFLLY